MPRVNTQEEFFDLVAGDSQFGRTPKWKILIEGDSWVSHPFLQNLCMKIDNMGGDDFAILNLARPGDTAHNMLKEGGRQLKVIDQLLFNERFGYHFDMIFISAAGNDIVGEEIMDFIDPHGSDGRTGADLINNKFTEILNQNVIKGYENLLLTRAKSKINKNTPIITHCYGYLKPRLVGTKAFGAMFGKGWVKRYLDEKNIPDNDQLEIIQAMLDRFYDGIKSLESKFDNFLVVDTRKILMKQGKPNVKLWHDEIHPTSRGFKKIGMIIRKEAKAKRMWPG